MTEHSHECPLAAVDRRLQDAHRQWHQAETSYFEPDAFRLAIQSAIQTLRTVSFLIQSHKSLIPEFQPWYQEWQDRLRSDPLMRWMVDARNKIEKRGDLEMFSFVRAEIIASYLEEGPRQEVRADLFAGPTELLASIPESDLGKHVREHGTLAIQRRWVENTLPDHELLDAVAIAYGRLSQLVCSAHEQMGLERPQTKDVVSGETYAEGERGGRLPCMIGHAQARTIHISLVDGRGLTLTSREIPFDLEEAEEAASKFSVSPEEIFPSGEASATDVLRSLFDTARKIFMTSGYHDTIYFLLLDGVPIHIGGMRPEDQGQKYLIMRNLGEEVSRRGADAVIMLGEMWVSAYDPTKPYQRAALASDRKEYLTASLVQKIAEPLQLMAEISRDGDHVHLGETISIENPTMFNFAPVYDAWGRQIPAEWMAASSAGDGGQPRSS